MVEKRVHCLGLRVSPPEVIHTVLSPTSWAKSVGALGSRWPDTQPGLFLCVKGRQLSPLRGGPLCRVLLENQQSHPFQVSSLPALAVVSATFPVSFQPAKENLPFLFEPKWGCFKINFTWKQKQSPNTQEKNCSRIDMGTVMKQSCLFLNLRIMRLQIFGTCVISFLLCVHGR